VQKIERYGVIALVVLLVTILAVSLWGESKSGWQFWKKDAARDGAGADARPGRRGGVAAQPFDVKSLPLAQPLPSPLAAGPAADPLAPGSLGAKPAAPAQPEPAQPGPQGALSAPASAPLASPLLVPPSSPALVSAPPASGPQPSPVLRGERDGARPDLAPGGTRKVTVRSGDTLGEIAARELGASSRWTEIQTLNGNLDPKKLRAGMTLLLPAGRGVAAAPDAARAPHPKAGGRATYTVRGGDTLSRIAARELGDGDRWAEIRDLNPGLDPRSLKVGAKLVLPASTVAKLDAPASRERIGWGPQSNGKSRVQ
jgi:nucleoid-associated protein YgaU